MLTNHKFWYAVSGALILFGAAGALNIIIHGEHSMGTSNYVPWGALIAGYVFFVVSSTGLSLVAALGHVFHMKRFEPLAKRAVLGSIITLLMGFIVIGLELGSPFSMIHILFSPNFQSAIFWMGLLYGIYLVLLVFEFIFLLKDDHKKSRLFGILVLISAIAAHSNLGAVFGFLVARSYWTGPYMSIYFILSALLSGAALLAFMYFLVSKVKRTEDMQVEGSHIVSHLGKLMVLFLSITVFFTVWKILTGVYGAVPGKHDGIMALLAGPLSFQFYFFELGFGMIIPLLILTLPGGFKPARVFAAAAFALVGIFVMRIDLVFAGQMIPLEPVKGALLPQFRDWTITWAEWGVMAGAIGGAVLLYLMGERKWNLETAPHEEGEDEKAPVSVQLAKKA
ncbi:NrfD/PsrC family molybdoenzyme membrane anchor subunit [Salipaludibacillus aurantiacus]|uniref:Prokaryotic molybdopterin-containing oxidoreductase family, membrane subunit n=1 Tax=Salipaludibacillus aurantiacus TaxID=1601833 RepID=A0A1H9SCR9_9BACI|nr:NrfD/PsrC family molybdoenzyme membrane anchor subunit [Salipaludibacillus aurantiacus]SER82708.1 prokaryotic molybdopterin-containing oxidoreductase family, membrane subunit [Salipaludibacillus aurantiacus]